MLIGLCGLAGSGKDTCGDFLVRDHGYAKVSFADPLKRICQEVYGFTDDQLWGPSASRNAPDERYPRPGQEPAFLTPRLALQVLGTEFGRFCYESTWTVLALRIAEKIRTCGNARYTAHRGLHYAGDRREWTNDDELAGVVIPDVRFQNEIAAVKNAGGRVFRIVRPGSGLGGAAGLHPSEVEQASIPDEAFDYVIRNEGSLDDLAAIVANLVT